MIFCHMICNRFPMRMSLTGWMVGGCVTCFEYLHWSRLLAFHLTKRRNGTFQPRGDEREKGFSRSQLQRRLVAREFHETFGFLTKRCVT